MPNPWGFKDTLGNVKVWCADVSSFVYVDHNAYYDECAREGTVIDPIGPPENQASPDFTIRGGSWATGPLDTRCASHGGTDRRFRSADVGFRCARTL
jgi:formylglycine-generating enzyme required for sulfatase activity